MKNPLYYIDTSHFPRMFKGASWESKGDEEEVRSLKSTGYPFGVPSLTADSMGFRLFRTTRKK